MAKAGIIAAATFIVLSVGLFVVLRSSHIDIFPGIEHRMDFQTQKLVHEDGAISLLDHSRGIDMAGEGAELTAGGYVVAVLVILVLPLAIGAVVFWLLTKRGGGGAVAEPVAPAE